MSWDHVYFFVHEKATFVESQRCHATRTASGTTAVRGVNALARKMSLNAPRESHTGELYATSLRAGLRHLPIAEARWFQ